MKIMVIGADGLCGTSLVPLLEQLQPDAELILIDESEESNPPIIEAKVELNQILFLLRSFQMERGDILIDLTTELSKTDVLQAADNVGVSVINATCCEKDKGAISLVDLLDQKLLMARYHWQVPHLIDAGMNPGNVNALLSLLVERHGNPIEVVQWEMDSTIPFNWDGEGFATWSPAEFASEFCDESTWEVDGKTVIFADGPPIDNKLEMPDGNTGVLCQHEEIIKWGWLYGCRAKYIYGYAEKAMAAIEKNIRVGLELPLCCKLEGRIPTGGDKIGLSVTFESGIVNASISAANDDPVIPIKSNATSYLVACGVATAVEVMRNGNVKKGINWPDDFGKMWIDYLVKNNLCNVDV
jgi:hypothetical protein